MSSFWHLFRGEVFVLILTITHLDITFDHSFYVIHLCFFYVSACDLIFACCLSMCVSGG